MNRSVLLTKRGQTLVEFALILPVFIFLVVVIFDFGRLIYYYNAIHNAAREGARFGVINPNNSGGMKSAVATYAISLGIQPADVPEPTVQASTPVSSSGTYSVKVTVDYCFKPITPIVKFIIQNTDCTCGCSNLLLSSSAEMRTETKPESP